MSTGGGGGGGGGRIEITQLSKWYGEQQVLDSIDLTIEAGEFFSLLGPSGCGKTTTLRLIGGFEDIEHGTIRIDGVDMGSVAPERRPVNTVFQSYALFPHKSVADNVAFGLRFVDCTKAEAKRRVGEALELVRLTGLEGRRPHQLSGGQQQRVALARSLVLRPKVLLLDEPLGALDAKLRRVLQVELHALHQEAGITFVYVTHDQEEALTMSDRLAVMRTGEIEQIGTPRQVYDAPASSYVADFLGLANLLDADATDHATVLLDGVALPALCGDVRGPCTILIRPERVHLGDSITGDSITGTSITDTSDASGSSHSAQLQGIVQHMVFAGAVTHVHLHVGQRQLQAVMPNDGSHPTIAPGSSVTLTLAADAIRVLPA